MKQVTVNAAIEAIQKRFCGLAEIVNVETSHILDIICKDIYSDKWYEVYSNEEWTILKIKQIIF